MGNIANRSKSFTASVTAAVLLALSAAAAADFEEEVVVTAQKREETLQEVPLTISAFGDEFLREHQVTDLKELIKFTPGISGSTPDGFLDSVSVRGISSNSYGSGAEPSVGIFLDGIYQTRTGTVPSLLDVQRVEMIKGPQGTLFGRNTSSGSINVISNEPVNELSGTADVSAGEYGRRYAAGVINVPLHEDFYARAALMKEKESGFIKNRIDGRELGGFDIEAARFAVRYTGFEIADVNLSTYYEDREQDGALYRALGTAAAFDVIESDLSDDSKDESEIFGVTLRVDLDLFGGSLSSITGYKTSNYTYVEDYDGTAALIDHFGRDQDQQFWSQELRLVSEIGSRLRWFAGANYYYEDLKADFFDRTDEETVCQAYLEDSCANAWAPDPFTANPAGLLEPGTSDGKYTGWGVFAELTWSLTDRIDLIVGGRYTHDKREFSLFVPEPDSDLGPFYIFGFSTTMPISDTADWNNFSPRAVVEFAATDDLNLYASYSQGYKAGGYDSFTVVDNDFAGLPLGPDARLAKFDEETVESWEVGFKGEFFDRRLRLDASGYYYEYSDLQETFYVGPITVTGNVGEATGHGVEADMRLFPHEFVDVAFGFSYMETDVSGIPDDLCDNCEGNSLPFAPEFSLSLIVNFTYPLALGEFFARSEFFYVDEQFYDLDNTREIINGAYDTTDFRLGWRSPDERWSTSVYVKNAFDEEYYLWGFAEEFPIPATQLDPSQGRAVGLEIRFTY